MASDNLIPQNERTKEEQREIARKGGKASGEARRKKKTLREAMQTMLELELTDKEIKTLAEKGYTANNQLEALAAAALMSAKRGNSQSFNNVMKLLGEGTENVTLTVTDDSTAAMDEFFEHERTAFKSDSE